MCDTSVKTSRKHFEKGKKIQIVFFFLYEVAKQVFPLLSEISRGKKKFSFLTQTSCPSISSEKAGIDFHSKITEFYGDNVVTTWPLDLEFAVYF